MIDTDKMERDGRLRSGAAARHRIRQGRQALAGRAGDDDTIQVIDTESLKLIGNLPSGPDPELFVQNPAGKTLYVANENDNIVTDHRSREAGRSATFPSASSRRAWRSARTAR